MGVLGRAAQAVEDAADKFSRPIDLLLNDFAREWHQVKYLLVPNLAQHIGAVSSSPFKSRAAKRQWHPDVKESMSFPGSVF